MNDRAPSYPEHDRTSCNESNPNINATADGSTGCARCTALLLERETMTAEFLAAYAKGTRKGRDASPLQKTELITSLLELYGLR